MNTSLNQSEENEFIQNKSDKSDEPMVSTENSQSNSLLSGLLGSFATVATFGILLAVRSITKPKN